MAGGRWSVKENSKFRIWDFRLPTTGHWPPATPLAAQYSSDVITVLAPDGTVLYNTAAVGPVLGYMPDELTGRSAFDPASRQ